MIREMKESDLQGASSDEIIEMVKERVQESRMLRISEADIEAGAAIIDDIRKMKPAVRAVIATYLRSNELFCWECGATSCIHGYPDY